MSNTYLNPNIFIVIGLIIISYYVLFTTLSSSFLILGIISIILIILYLLKHVFSLNIDTYFRDFLTPKPKIDIIVDYKTPSPVPSPVPEIKFKKQVFNIPGNYYDYDNAEAVCKAYGAELATYEQVEQSYNKGAEWCNYGWSANQLALFPTQSQTYNNLQKIPGHEHDCGRPGINGGYIANPKVKFGINCFGDKPRITEEEDNLMKTATPYPLSAEDIAFQKRVDYWKNHVSNILVSPFNYDKWTSF
jgi:hypothetical protein